MHSFEPVFIRHAKQQYTCFACERVIPQGSSYMRQAAKDGSKVEAIHLCPECTYLITESDMETLTLRPGCFTDRLIPNCLRHKRAEFRQHLADTTKTKIQNRSKKC